MEIFWKEPARDDRCEILEFTAEENIKVASTLLAEINDRVTLFDSP